MLDSFFIDPTFTHFFPITRLMTHVCKTHVCNNPKFSTNAIHRLLTSKIHDTEFIESELSQFSLNGSFFLSLNPPEGWGPGRSDIFCQKE